MQRLPILFSHGHGRSNNLSSLNGYAPLASFWAAHGFAVIQPTHLSSRALSHLIAGTPGAPFFWRSRAEDMTDILDQLDVVESAVPQLAGRIDHDAVAVAGHSLGGFTASLLLGARITDPATGEVVNLAERVAAVGWLSSAYLRSQFQPGDNAWQAARDALTTGPDAFGQAESK